MKRRSRSWWLVSLLGMVMTTLADGPVAMSVQVKTAQLRATPSFLGQLVAPVNYGDRLQVIEKQGDWSKATAPGGQTGWIHTSALTKKEISMKAGGANAQSGASSDEVALAGKGFNSAVEADFKNKNKNIDFTWVDKMEKIKVPADSMQKFLKDGGVAPSEGGKR